MGTGGPELIGRSGLICAVVLGRRPIRDDRGVHPVPAQNCVRHLRQDI